MSRPLADQETLPGCARPALAASSTGRELRARRAMLSLPSSASSSSARSRSRLPLFRRRALWYRPEARHQVADVYGSESRTAFPPGVPPLSADRGSSGGRARIPARPPLHAACERVDAHRRDSRPSQRHRLFLIHVTTGFALSRGAEGWLRRALSDVTNGGQATGDVSGASRRDAPRRSLGPRRDDRRRASGPSAYRGLEPSRSSGPRWRASLIASAEPLSARRH
jgi:hypothetical protein